MFQIQDDIKSPSFPTVMYFSKRFWPSRVEQQRFVKRQLHLMAGYMTAIRRQRLCMHLLYLMQIGLDRIKEQYFMQVAFDQEIFWSSSSFFSRNFFCFLRSFLIDINLDQDAFDQVAFFQEKFLVFWDCFWPISNKDDPALKMKLKKTFDLTLWALHYPWISSPSSMTPLPPYNFTLTLIFLYHPRFRLHHPQKIYT